MRNSIHPLSKKIFSVLEGYEFYPVTGFKDIPGSGLEGIVFGHSIKLGSAEFTKSEQTSYDSKFINDQNSFSTKVYLKIDEIQFGYFELSNSYREGIDKAIQTLDEYYDLSLLSGDNEGERINLIKYFKNDSQLFFNQSPKDKLDFIAGLQNKDKKVLMD